MKLLYMILFCIVCHSAGTLAIGTDSTLCETGLIYSQTVDVLEKGNVLKVFNPQTEAIYIVALDYNKDGYYEVLVFDTDGDGYADMQLEGGIATAEQVILIYCGYMKLSMS